MELRDLIVTPLLIIIIYVVAYFIRPLVTDQINRRYFFPALSLRIFGALAVGFIYQFYYHGGDTFNFHTHGSRHVWEAFWDSPVKAFKLLFADKSDLTGIYEYASRVAFYRDDSSYFIVKLAFLFDLFTFSSYSATAICFAVLSFTGSWLLFLTFYQIRPQLVKPIALATLFIPSVFFWGAGLLKDTVTLAFLGMATFSVRQIFIQRRPSLWNILMLIISFIVIYSVKKYILLCFVPAVIFWMAMSYLSHARSVLVKILILPVLAIVVTFSGYFGVGQIAADDPRYTLDRIAYTARETAYDIAYQTGRDAGSPYYLGELDNSFGSLLALGPQAVNVSLFRPYLWEVRNPLMMLSSIESTIFLVLTLFLIFRNQMHVVRSLKDPVVLFCFAFSITFAFAVGVSTFNFGTLSRYKIPLLPFYGLFLAFIHDYANKARKLSTFDLKE